MASNPLPTIHVSVMLTPPQSWLTFYSNPFTDKPYWNNKFPLFAKNMHYTFVFSCRDPIPTSIVFGNYNRLFIGRESLTTKRIVQ